MPREVWDAEQQKLVPHVVSTLREPIRITPRPPFPTGPFSVADLVRHYVATVDAEMADAMQREGHRMVYGNRR